MAKTKPIINNLVIISFFLSAASLLLSLFIVVNAVVLYSRTDKLPQPIFPITTPAPIDPFADCKQISGSCDVENCKYNTLCTGVDANYKICAIYDCGENYGVMVADRSGQSSVKEYAKPDINITRSTNEDCKGSVSVISNKCENNTQKIVTEVKTSGDCPAEAFMYKQGNDWQSVDFSNIGSNRYQFSYSPCGGSEINIVGKAGMNIGNAVIKKISR